MTPRPGPRARHDERGYIAVTTGLILLVLMCFSAFAVDVGNWYLTGQRAQRAADAAALAGVTKLPGNQTGAFSMAQSYSSNNGFTQGVRETTVTTSLSGGPTRLRVDVTRTVDNIFGSLLGRPQTTISRYAVADFAGPVPLGSPCNRFGDDPDPGSTSSENCDNTGLFWANVGSPGARKVSGDAFQNNNCTSGEDGCSGTKNMDYDARGHVFTVTLRQPVSQLKIEAFDPAQVYVGDVCDKNNLAGAKNLAPADTLVSDPSVRYAPNAGVWCTGDQSFSNPPSAPNDKGLIRTQFIIREPGTNPWDPTTWPIVNRCTQQFLPYNGDLAKVLKKGTAEYNANPHVALNFRRWVTLCEFPGTTQPGTYAIQVQTNGLGSDLAGGHNRFGLRASGSSGVDKDNISIAGFGKMVMYANTPGGARTRFFLAPHPVVLQRPDLQRQPLRHRRRCHQRKHHHGPAAHGGRRHLHGLQGQGRDERQPHGLQDLGQLDLQRQVADHQRPDPGVVHLHRRLPDGLLGAARVLLRQRVDPLRHHVVAGLGRG